MKIFDEKGGKAWKKKLKYIPFFIICISIFIIGTHYVRQLQNTKSLTSETDINQESKKMKKVLIATKDLKAGDFIDNSSFKEKEVDISETKYENALVDYQTGMLQDQRIRVDLLQGEALKENMLIHKNIWYETGDRYVEHQFPEGAILTTFADGLLVGKLVDIVLFKADAEDQIVISKAAVIAANGTRLAFNLSTSERENLKEAALEPGGLYLIAYLADNQEASQVTYIPTYQLGQIISTNQE